MSRKQKIIKRVKQTLKEEKNLLKIVVNSVKKKNPKYYKFAWENDKFKPDIEAVYENRKDLFSIETSFNRKLSKNYLKKWLLLSNVAHSNGGTFYVITGYKNYSYCKKLIKENNVVANIIPALT